MPKTYLIGANTSPDRYSDGGIEFDLATEGDDAGRGGGGEEGRGREEEVMERRRLRKSFEEEVEDANASGCWM